MSRGERACSLPVTRTRVRAGVAPRGCPVREGVERVVSVYLRDGVDESRPSTSTATRRGGECGGRDCNLDCCGAHTWRVMPFGALVFMATRSEPLGSRPAPLGSKRDAGIRGRGPSRRRSKLPERERSSSLASGLVLAALEGDLAKGQRESGSKRAALEGDLSHNHACPHPPPGPRGERPRGHE